MSEMMLPTPPGGVEWSKTHLQVVDPDLAYETFEGLVAASGEIGDTARWWIGDLILFGEGRYGERYAQALEAARVGERSVRRYAYVCRQIGRGRRRPNLSFSHHEAVARLEPDEQDRLLSRAEDETLTRDELLGAVRDISALTGTPPKPRQQIVGAREVDAVRNLGLVRETLVRVGKPLDAETAEAIGIPAAIRAIDETGTAVVKAAEKLASQSLADAARAVVAASWLAQEFYAVDLQIFESFAAIVAAE